MNTVNKREVVLWLILSIVTCGIFNLVWIALMANDLRELANEPEDMSGGIVVLLAIVTCGIYLIYWYYKAGKSIEKAKYMRNMPADNSSGMIYLVLAILGLAIVSNCLIQNEINSLVDFQPVNNGVGFDNPANYYKDSKPYDNQNYYNPDNNFNANTNNTPNQNYDPNNNINPNQGYNQNNSNDPNNTQN